MTRRNQERRTYCTLNALHIVVTFVRLFVRNRLELEMDASIWNHEFLYLILCECAYVEIFHWSTENFDLLGALEEKSGERG